MFNFRIIYFARFWLILLRIKTFYKCLSSLIQTEYNLIKRGAKPVLQQDLPLLLFFHTIQFFINENTVKWVFRCLKLGIPHLKGGYQILEPRYPSGIPLSKSNFEPWSIIDIKLLYRGLCTFWYVQLIAMSSGSGVRMLQSHPNFGLSSS